MIFVEDWLIERKIDLSINETKCRASIPSHANWFGARVRIGPSNELIKPIWISVRPDQVIDSKLTKIKELLEDVCDNIFNPDPFFQQGGDMVRVGGMTYECYPKEKMGHRIKNLKLI